MDPVGKAVIVIVVLLFVGLLVGIQQAHADTLYCNYGQGRYRDGTVTEGLPNGLFVFKTKDKEIIFSYLGGCIVEHETE